MIKSIAEPQGRTSDTASRLTAHLPFFALLITLALTVVAYWTGLRGPLVFDDAANLEPLNDWLQGHVGWTSVVFENDSGLLGRSLSMASFLVNVALLGPDSWGLKLGNLLIHLLNGILAFTLFTRLIRVGALTRKTDRSAYLIAWLGASIWLLHPFLASTVLYVVQRMAMLSALFTLLTMLAYLHGRETLIEKRKHVAFVMFVVVVPACTLLATLSKENGILAPALCAVIELIVFRPAPKMHRSRFASTFIAVALVLPAAIAIILTLIQLPFIASGYLGRPFTLLERMLTEPRVLWDYIGNLAIPNGPQMGFYHDDFRISHDLFDPATTTFAIGAWLVAITAAWRLREIIPGLALGLGIFLVGHSLESTIFPLIIYFEHRNYLPAVGAIWAILSVIAFLSDKIKHKLRYASPIFALAALVLMLVLVAGTAARANVWATQRDIIAQGVLFHPDSKGARFDSITFALAQRPPDFTLARRDADWLRNASEPNTRRLGMIERTLIDCTLDAKADPGLVQEMFAGPADQLEEDLMHAFEFLSDGVASRSCTDLSPAQMADGLAGMLDRWELSGSQRSNWRLRFRAANLYMAVNQNENAIKQAKLAYADGRIPINTAIMIAGLLLYCGDTVSAKNILDTVERKLRPSDKLAREIVLDDRNKIREAEQERAQRSKVKN